MIQFEGYDMETSDSLHLIVSNGESWHYIAKRISCSHVFRGLAQVEKNDKKRFRLVATYCISWQNVHIISTCQFGSIHFFLPTVREGQRGVPAPAGSQPPPPPRDARPCWQNIRVRYFACTWK